MPTDADYAQQFKGHGSGVITPLSPKQRQSTKKSLARRFTSLPWIEKPVAGSNFSSEGRLPIKNVVLHTTDGTLPGTLSWFNNSAAGVSSNYVLDVSGQIYALLEEYYVPYTNGNWPSNQQSVTIEIVDNGNPQGTRPDSMYNGLVPLVRDICQYYGLPINRTTIRGHREVSSTHPQCPGSVDLDRVAKEAAGATPTPPPSPTNPADIVAKLRPILYFENAWWKSLYRVKKMKEILR